MSEKASITSSVEDAVHELLSMTNDAVRKLTESKPQKDEDASISSSNFSANQFEDDNLMQYQADKRLLEILSETQHTHKAEGQDDVVINKEEEVELDTSMNSVKGKIVDVTNLLEEEPRSEVSILDVGGGQPDTISSISTPSTISQDNLFQQKSAYPKESLGGLPGDSILSPISFPSGFQSVNNKDEVDSQNHEDSFPAPESKKVLTCSIKSSSDSASIQNSTGNSSTASEVLKQSTRAPQLPESVKILSKTPNPKESQKAQNVSDKTALTTVHFSQKRGKSTEPSTHVIILKSNHVPPQPIQKNSNEKPEQSKHRVRIPKKRLREVKSPMDREEIRNKSDSRTQQFQTRQLQQYRSTLAQGVEIEDKENKDLNSSLKIIKSNKDMAKKKLLQARGTGLNLTKKVVTANIIDGSSRQQKTNQDHMFSTALATAMATATPMLQVKQDLETQVRRLTEKLDELEKQKQQEEANKHQDRADDLERKLEQLTTQRLRSLEQLQEQQATWQSHFLRVIGNIQNSQDNLTVAARKKSSSQPSGRSVRFNGIGDSPNVLQTPAPRAQAPLPFSSKSTKGTSPGNGYLLRNILDQMDVSTPGPSPAIPTRMTKLGDPLADLTPVRGPTEKSDKFPRDGSNPVNMTSTPQVELDTRTAILQSRKDAAKEAERLEIMRRFPTSLSVYMVQDPGPPNGVQNQDTDTRPSKPDSSVDGLWKVLEELQTTRKYLDENLAAVERGRGGENIAAKVDFEILSKNPKSDPAAIEKLRIRKMVDEQIKYLQKQIKVEVSKDLPQSKVTGAVGQRGLKGGKLPMPRPGARVDTGLRRKQPFQPKTNTTSVKARKAPRARSSSPQTQYVPDLSVCPDDEEFVTHVYGKADYHPRRSTVHNPYIHVKSPMKQPMFRKKQAVEVVKANFIKSAKTQTSPTTTKQSQYYFSPCASPVHPPISVSPTPGQLIPMAIPLGAPRMSDVGDPALLLIHQTDPRFVTLTTGPQQPQRTIRVYNPTTDGFKKPNTVVINIKGDDGPDLAVQKLDNIDIDTPDVSEARDVFHHPPVQDELPGASNIYRHDQDESEGTDGSLHIELCGGAGSETQVDYHGPTFPPVAPPERHLKSSDIADEIDKHEIEQETVRWVEQEILARILSELYPPGSQKIKDSGPVEEEDSDEPCGEQNSVLLNPESLQLFIDAGLPIDDATVNRLVEEELTKILREMIRRPAHDQTTRPKTPVPAPRPVTTQISSYQVPTPLPTPEPSPASSVSERPKPHLHTPSLTPDSSMAESLPPKEPSPVSSPEPQPSTPKAESPPKTPEDVTLVETPEATPPNTPTPEPIMPGTPTSEISKTPPPVSPPLKFPDPWGGAEFPLPEELHRPKPSSAMTFAPPPDAVDLVVRAVTPPPDTPPDRSLSEPESTTTSSERGESSISEGQLVISHGEMRLKTKRGQLPEIIEELFGDEDVERSMKFQSTLRDANEIQDYEPYSDGEIRLGMRPAMIARVAGHDKPSQRSQARRLPPGDDPVGIYARPRYPIPSESEGEEMSVGEVKPKTIENRRDKFRKWRQERSPRYSGSRGAKPQKVFSAPNAHEETILPDSPLSMDDLHKRERSLESSEVESDGTSQLSDPPEKLGGNVIVVTPAVSKQEMPQQSRRTNQAQIGVPFQRPPILSTLGSEDLERLAASTDQSAIIKDSLDESMRKKNDLDGFFDDKGPTPLQPALKVSLTLPSIEPVLSSEPITDDISEISTGGL